MTNSILAKVAIAAAATVITLTPALADRNDHRHHNKPHHVERGHRDGYHGDNRHWHSYKPYYKPYGHRHWKNRFYGWNNGYKPYRRWW